MPGILDPRTQGLLSAGLGLMQAGGPSRMPVSLGQAIGQAGQQGLGVYNRSAEQQQNMAIQQKQLQLQRMMREQQAEELRLRTQERQRQAGIQQRISQKLAGVQGQPIDVVQSTILPELFEADPMGATKMLEGIQQRIADREEKIRQFNTSLEDKRLAREQQEAIRRDMMGLQAQQNAATNAFRSAQLSISKQNAETARLMAGQGGKAPAGYRWKEGGEELEPIPGGPATVMGTEAAAKASLITTGIQDVERFKNLVIKDGKVDRALINQMIVPGGMPRTDARKAYSYIYNAIEAKLRAESGAAVPETEVTRMARRFVPGVFDNDDTIKDKVQRLDEFLKGTIPLTKGMPKMPQPQGKDPWE